MRGYRVGVVHPNSPFGQRVRELLGEGQLPVIELKLLETELPGEASLAQFGDEVVVTQPLDPDLFPHLDVLFVAAEDSDVVNRVARLAAEQGVLTIVHAASGLEAPVVFSEETKLDERLVVVPRMGSYLLGRTLSPLVEALDVRGALATLLLPAEELGSRAANELPSAGGATSELPRSPHRSVSGAACLQHANLRLHHVLWESRFCVRE